MNTFQQNKGVIAFCALAASPFLLAGVSLLFLGAPELDGQQSAKAKQPKADRSSAIAACEIKLERTLRDPGSVRYERDLHLYSFDGSKHNVTLAYNAKNAFGGYVGTNVYSCTFKA
jgi:hypothetical protein